MNHDVFEQCVFDYCIIDVTLPVCLGTIQYVCVCVCVCVFFTFFTLSFQALHLSISATADLVCHVLPL